MSNDSVVNELSFSADDLVKLQMDRAAKLENVKANYKKCADAAKTPIYFVRRLQQIDDIISEFRSAHKVIVCNTLETDDDYFKKNIALNVEELYFDLYCSLVDDRENRFPTPQQSGQSTSSGQTNVASAPSQPISTVNYPDIPNPIFSGNTSDWPEFQDAFTRLIHQNIALDPIQKFHFLKLGLPPNCDKDIHLMPLSSQNYGTAWDLLVERYNIPRILHTSQMNTLFALPTITKERSEDLKQLLNIANVCVNELRRLDIPIDTCNHWLVYLLVTKLPKETHSKWESHLGSSKNIPTFKDFSAFLSQRIITVDVMENRTTVMQGALNTTKAIDHQKPNNSTIVSKPNQRHQRAERKTFHVTATQPKVDKCVLCGGAHIIRKCPTFLAKDCFERKNIVDKHKLCLNCMSGAHYVNQCSSQRNCLQCGGRHHTLLHFNFNANSTGNTGPNESNQRIQTCTTSMIPTIKQPPKVLLATALIPVVNTVTGRKLILRALIDQASEGTLITRKGANALGLRRTPMITDVDGVGNNSDVSTEYVSFALQSNLNENFETFVEMAFVVDRITSQLPSKQIIPHDWPHIRTLVLADPTYFKVNHVDLLIGNEMHAAILLPDQRIGHPDHPVAQNSQFGWLLFGKTEPPASNKTPSSFTVRCHHTTVEAQLDSLVRKFYDTEQVPEERTLSQEDKWFVDFFHRTTVRQPNGKYLVRLPLKTIFDPNQTIGRSKQISLNRFHHLERRLQRKEGLMDRYTKGIHEYFELNQILPSTTTEDEHCTFTQTNQFSVTSCVLAHHHVLKEDSLTTKLRIVMNASAKTSNGKSLNDILCVGPALQNELPAVILNWRLHEFVFTCDIQKMYRCIDMHHDDIPYQKILWRNKSGEIQEFCLTTVTFGTAPAPCTAIMVVHRIANDEKERYPLAENVLKHEMYVDDVQTGSHSIEQAIAIRDDVTGALASAGMELRKWASNTPALLESIPKNHQCSSTLLDMNSDETIKTLGMCWKPSDDVFKFTIKFDLPTTITKRTVLSTTARLFDPMGFIAPVVVASKMILKRIWNYHRELEEKEKENENVDSSNIEKTVKKLGWDDPIPEPLSTEWQKFIAELPSIKQITIPRWINHSPGQSIQLHAFCDGSTKAYAANVYIRLESREGRIHTHLIMAKSKVTPTQPLSMPRTELCGAELATRLAAWVKKNLRIDFNHVPIYYWCDATVVLHWIHGDITRWKTFVANRVSKILSHSSPNMWNHVITTENPADCATRGLTPSELATKQLWWNGPAWLVKSPNEWPRFNNKAHTFDDDTLEAKTNAIHVHVTIPTESIVFHYSSLNTLIRITAWILRFRHNARKAKRNTRRYGLLSVIEMNDSRMRLVQLVQQEAFGKEMHLLRLKEFLPNSSKIRSLAPFIDENNILRVGGRLQRSNLPYEQRHPSIMPKNHHFTRLLIDHSHQVTLHGGVSLTLAHLRHQYWLLSSRQTVAVQLRKCVKCFRNKPETSNQMMGNLPFHRVNPPTRPFVATGVDYTGAIELKSSKYRGNTIYKGYIVVFICLATKAVHLEAVTGMSTEHFLCALHRFIGRRGLCQHMFSDNGTNFIGADNVLKSKDFVKAIESDVVPRLAEKGIQWHFNPPHSPNFGGLWEANVKSTKYHLKRIIEGTRLTYEELSTVLIRIESCLNSRPLCPLTSDIDDLDVLTPGHFLIGDALLAPPPEQSTAKLSLSNNYIALQRMIQQFWSQWSSDWLSLLQNRPKWHQAQPNLKLNEMVLIKDDRLPPNEWLLGRVTELHPGSDQLVRVATIRTKNGHYKRPISKLCRLPIDDEEAVTSPSQQ